MSRALVIALVCLLPAAGQDVYLGGRVDLEASFDDEVTFGFGRLAGIDLTFTKPGVLDAYVDIVTAGGEVRLQELYLSLPQTRRVCDVILGRWLAPYGDSRTDPVDRYAVGARDLYDPYAAWRPGNAFLDVDLTGVLLARRDGWLSWSLGGGTTPGNDALAAVGRLEVGDEQLRAGTSVFFGEDTVGESLTHAALHAGWAGRRLTALGQLYVGQAAGGDLRGWLWRVGYRLPGAPLDLRLSQTLFHDDLGGSITTTRLGLTGRLGENYRAEARYEWRTAPPPFDDDQLVLRLLAVF